MAKAKRVETIWPGQVRAILGPAEGQYGTVTLAMRGANGAPIACGSTVVDESPEDLSAGIGNVVVFLVWNDLPNETGFRRQTDALSTTFVTEDSFNEFPPNTTSDTIGNSPGLSQTNRIMAHVGHLPGHGATPIAGDVLSNTCTFTAAAAPS